MREMTALTEDAVLLARVLSRQLHFPRSAVLDHHANRRGGSTAQTAQAPPSSKCALLNELLLRRCTELALWVPSFPLPPSRAAVIALAASSSGVMLGLCAADSNTAVETLKRWTAGLGLPKGESRRRDSNIQRHRWGLTPRTHSWIVPVPSSAPAGLLHGMDKDGVAVNLSGCGLELNAQRRGLSHPTLSPGSHPLPPVALAFPPEADTRTRPPAPVRG